MAAAAEQTNRQPWLLAQEAFPGAELQARIRMRSYLGSVAIRGEAEAVDPENIDDSTLMATLELAAAGDEQSERVVGYNVRTDISERLYKIGQSKAELEFVGGRLQQEGMPVLDIHRNTLEHTVLVPEMELRTKQESSIVMLFEELTRIGATVDHDVIVWSPTSTKMTEQQKKDYHFFLDTESCSIQRLSVDGEDVLLETAFVAGKATPDSPRHDIDTILKLSAEEGIAVHTIDGTEMQQYVMLVPKSEIPNGIVDIVQRYDKAAGGTFYGEAKPQQDYVKFAEECEQRNQKFETMASRITRQLITESAAGAFDTPLEAIERLDYLSERLCVKHATKHKDINAAVFGPVAALHIETAIFHFERGNEAQGNMAMRKAQSTAVSGSCPLFKGIKNPESDDGSDNNTSSESSGKKFMKCPHCDAKVFADPCAAILSCWDCSAMVINGNVKAGNGGSKARAAKNAARKLIAEQRLQAKAERQMKKSRQLVGV